MSTSKKRSQSEAASKGLREARAKKVPLVYHELAPGWRVTADSMAWKLERQGKGGKGSWMLVGYCANLSQILTLFANARVRVGVEDGQGILESVRQAAAELADLIARIKDATLILEQPKGKIR